MFEAFNYVERVMTEMESPFEWDLPDPESMEGVEPEHWWSSTKSNRKFIAEQKQKVETLTNSSEASGGEVNQFNWRRYVTKLSLAYEIWSDTRNMKEACEYINACQAEIEELLKKKCEDALFIAVKRVIFHVAHATKVYILFDYPGFTMWAKTEAEHLQPYLKLTTAREKAGLMLLKAALFREYGAPGLNEAQELQAKARELDPELCFILEKATAQHGETTQ